jgi:hypothetical protein
MGAAMGTLDTAEQHRVTVGVGFAGTALGFFGRSLLTGLASILVIPAPWVAVWLYRWCVEKLRFTDGTQASFSGEGAQIWAPMMATMVIGYIGQFDMRLSLLAIPVSCYLSLVILKWFWKNLVPSCGTRLSFVGGYLPFLGWTVLTYVSFITIVGWAWVSAAMMRWLCRNIEGDNVVVEFHGDGWNILWRTVVFALSCILLIPIPWTTLWLLRWYLRNVSIQRTMAVDPSN